LGAGCCMTSYTNNGQDGYIGLTPLFPAKIIAEKLPKEADGHWIVKKRGYMASHGNDVKVEASWDCCSTTCCCGALGCVRQKLSSPSGEGTMFLNAGGTIMKKVLADGEVILIDHNSIVAFKDTVDYKLQMIGNCMMCCCGGDGMCGAKMTGPGEVYMQSMSFEKFVKSVAPSQAQ